MSIRIKIFLNLFLITSFYFSDSFSECNFNQADFNSDPTILSTINGKIKGECNNIKVNDPQNPNLSGSVFSWKGVPYAEPSINENRFKKPIPKISWLDIKNGTVWGKKCMQNGVGNQKDPNVSEDCLYLNVFVPGELYLNYLTRKGPKIPIIVFIHGGRFILGSSSDDSIDPSTSIVLSKVIYVTINYRLGPFGFMHLANTDISGNQGFLDQHLALKWVYENSDRFGGDNSKITLSGQSAGSFSTSYHLVYKPSWPYFQSAIMQSGTLLYSTMELYSSEELSKRTKAILTNCGCNFDTFKNNQDYFKCIQNIDPNLILSQSSIYETNVLLNNNSLASELNPLFQLVLDGIEFKETIKTMMNNNQVKKAKIMTGFTSHEGAFLLGFSGLFGKNPPELEQKAVADLNLAKSYLNGFYTYFPRYPLMADTNFANNILNEYTQGLNITNYFNILIQILSEEVFICPSIGLAEFMSKTSQVYFYSFEQVKTKSRYPKVYGTVHGDDLDYVFGQTLSTKVTQTPFGIIDPKQAFTDEEREFSKKLIIYWSNFIKTGDPNLGEKQNDISWPLFNRKSHENFFLKWFYDFLNSIINILKDVFSRFITSNNQNQNENNYIILSANYTKTSNEFIFENKYKRHCTFWRLYQNL